MLVQVLLLVLLLTTDVHLVKMELLVYLDRDNMNFKIEKYGFILLSFSIVCASIILGWFIYSGLDALGQHIFNGLMSSR